ncbi:predicted protein [Plenodomus lingam JN3]|uniref:Predicted protein n=1 Tax=Leptosphaeria maculans (strain JN3 / isolate v23.1.3 / race Av1-4-5-6-7-8) TaxID=985895 RepID=E4ZH39_LEPMJ|nr:predicted protein [Plenodomus lingam JN3]CBX90609.1 predicted protein [Plenodomus lingam JN3]
MIQISLHLFASSLFVSSRPARHIAFERAVRLPAIKNMESELIHNGISQV